MNNVRAPKMRLKNRIKLDYKVYSRNAIVILSKMLILFAFISLIFSNSEQYGAISQYFALACLSCSAFLLMFCASVPSGTRVFDLADIVMICICVFSYFVAIFQENNDCLLLTSALLITTIDIRIISNRISYEDILKIAIISYMVILGLIFIFQLSELRDSLDLSNPFHWKSRFTPFEMHPDLTGVFFGVGAVTASGAIFMKFRWKLVGMPVMFICGIIVLAASSRAALLSLIITATATVTIMQKSFSNRQRIYFMIFGILVLATAIILSDKIIEFAVGQLELDSADRGLDSGGSGRTELWRQGISLIFDDAVLLVTGRGFRQASADIIGFSTENSYITIALESGVPLMFMFLFVIIKAILKSRKIALFSYKKEFVVCFSIIVFMLFESIFNRYLLAVGNTASLILLLSVFSSYAKVYPKYNQRHRQKGCLPVKGHFRPTKRSISHVEYISTE